MVIVSTKSSPDLDRKQVLLLAVTTLLVIGIYLTTSALTFRIGFPLDDSWIYLTYARNLAWRGEWAFLPGQPSAGSTAPLWSALLALGFLLGLAPYVWTYLLGGIALFALAITAEQTARRLLPSYRSSWPLVGLFLIAEWHMTWAAASGMETLLHALLVTSVLFLLNEPTPRPLTLGLLAALSIWTRPDGLTLLGPIVLTLLLRPRPMPALVHFGLGFGVLFGLYLLFHLTLSGAPFPNTFYAKQAEYAAWQARPFLYKIGLGVLQLVTGPLLVLLPGVVRWGVKAVRQRAWGTLAGMIWAAGYVFLYTMRLPPYQHGRYLMPTMPALFVWGLLGVLDLFREAAPSPRLRRMRLAWALIVLFVTIGFVGMGAQSYAEDVAYIESEMVQVAKWVSVHLPPETLIAAHDIGALGYFDHHPLIDLAGLISPEVIPFLRDEAHLEEFLDQRQADYVIAFPSLYPGLADRLQPVYVSGGEAAIRLGGENLVVYRWSTR